MSAEIIDLGKHPPGDARGRGKGAGVQKGDSEDGYQGQ